MDWQLEQAATRVLDETNQGGDDVRVELVAKRLGLVVRDGGPGCHGLLFGKEILVDERLTKPRWNFVVAHEIGHFDAQRTGRRDTEWAANYFASALLLPRDAAETALRQTGRDLLLLMARFRHASGEAIARRISALREARVLVFDRPEGKPETWYGVPNRLRPVAAELEAAEASFAEGVPVEIYAGVTAWPLFQEGWQRVIVISDPDSAACAAGHGLGRWAL